MMPLFWPIFLLSIWSVIIIHISVTYFNPTECYYQSKNFLNQSLCWQW